MLATRNKHNKKILYQDNDQDEDLSFNCYSPKNNPHSKKKRNKKSQTKNIVLNYRTVIKKILNQILVTVELSCAIKQEIEETIKFMDQNTNLDMLRECLKISWFRQIMVESHETGLLMRYILQSSMYIQNKLYCIKFFNKLLNGIKNPEGLVRWKQLRGDAQPKINSIPQKNQIICKENYQDKIETCTNLQEQSLPYFDEYEMTQQRYERPFFVRINSSDPDILLDFF